MDLEPRTTSRVEHDVVVDVARRVSKERPKLRELAVEQGVEALTDDGLLGLLIERGVADEPLAARVQRVLQSSGGLDGLATFGVGALAHELSLGEACACRIAAAFELATRVARARASTLPTIDSRRAVEGWARTRLAQLVHEEVWVLLLDGRNRLRASRMVARGGTHSCALTAADLLRPAVREAASAVVIVHNHPSGDPCPTSEDLQFTAKAVAAGRCLGIAVVDHVVVARDASFSMLEAGMMA
ncbi:MAG: RadC family protein [Polyangiales bacterium]